MRLSYWNHPLYAYNSESGVYEEFEYGVSPTSPLTTDTLVDGGASFGGDNQIKYYKCLDVAGIAANVGDSIGTTNLQVGNYYLCGFISPPIRETSFSNSINWTFQIGGYGAMQNPTAPNPTAALRVFCTVLHEDGTKGDTILAPTSGTLFPWPVGAVYSILQVQTTCSTPTIVRGDRIVTEYGVAVTAIGGGAQKWSFNFGWMGTAFNFKLAYTDTPTPYVLTCKAKAATKFNAATVFQSVASS